MLGTSSVRLRISVLVYHMLIPSLQCSFSESGNQLQQGIECSELWRIYLASILILCLPLYVFLCFCLCVSACLVYVCLCVSFSLLASVCPCGSAYSLCFIFSPCEIGTHSYLPGCRFLTSLTLHSFCPCT